MTEGARIEEVLPFLTQLRAQTVSSIGDEVGIPVQELLASSVDELGQQQVEALADAAASRCMDAFPDRSLGQLIPRVSSSIGRPRGGTRLTNVLDREGLASWQAIAELTLSEFHDLHAVGRGTVLELVELAIEEALRPDHAVGVGVPHATRIIESEFLAAWKVVCAWAYWERSARSIDDVMHLMQEADLPAEVEDAGYVLASVSLKDLGAVYRGRFDISSALDELVDGLNEREQRVVFGRTLPLGKRTSYRDLAKAAGLSHERMRLMERAAVKKLRAAIATAPMGVVRREAERLRSELGNAAPVDDALPLLGLPSEGAPLDDAVQPPTQALLRLWIAGPYDLKGGWLITTPGDALLQRAEVACRGATMDGPITTDQFGELINALGVRRIWTKRFLELLHGFRLVDGHVAPWTGTFADKMAAVLSLRGEPMSKEELAAALGQGSAGTLVNYLGTDPRFVRVGKGVYGLKAWGVAEYVGIVGTMMAELDRRGGHASLDELREAVRAVGASPASVVFYTGGLLFVEEDGRYRRKSRTELAEVKPGPAIDAAGCFRGEDGWVFRHVVSGETLRGSGMPVPTRFCEAIGITGANRDATFTSDHGPISFRLSDQANLTVSSIRGPATELGCAEGDRLFVECAATEATFRAVRQSDLDRMSPVDRAIAEIGVSVERWGSEVMQAFWWGLGFPEDSPPDSERIRGRLLDRNEKELLYLFDRANAGESSD